MTRAASLMLLCALAACGTASRSFDDANHNGPPEDAGAPDASNSVPPDAEPQFAPTPSREIVSGAGRLSGATYTLDLQIGPSIGQQPASGATYTMEGNTAVKP